MNAQQLEYVRIQLRMALADNSGGTKGQLEAFAEHPPAEKQYYPRQPVHTIELDDGHGGLKRVKAENAAVYVLETRSRRRPLPPIDDYTFSLCAWRRAVNQLAAHEQAWLRYCYGHDLSFKYQTQMCEHVWQHHQRYLPDGLLRKTRKRLISLVWLAGQEVAISLGNDTYRDYSGAALARMLEVNRSTWLRVYASHWEALKDGFWVLDKSVLIHTVVKIPQEG
ncbi:bacteriophage antitermination protein Q [Mangrovibacter phragmitis]|uniref:bacteriophage antitermination protein Q n=1 Tax=Mangrovibacter phragmitis TaxID=1691903 RepID=UPI0035180DE3